MSWTGGCFCGHVRYDAGERTPDDTAHCHCTVCRRTTGAPLVTWAAFPRADFRFTAGAPAAFRSSPCARRWFCPRCGAQLAFDKDGDASMDVSVATLDDAASVAPDRHIWNSSALPWLRIDDHLPRQPEETPKP